MKKGRHRRYEKARELKKLGGIDQHEEALDVCPECADITHKEWCQFPNN